MIDVDAVDLHRLGVEIRPLEGRHVARDRLRAEQLALVVDIEQHGGDLQQGVGLFVESPGLDIDDYRQKAPESPTHRRRISHRVVVSSAASRRKTRPVL